MSRAETAHPQILDAAATTREVYLKELTVLSKTFIDHSSKDNHRSGRQSLSDVENLLNLLNQDK